MCGRFSCRLSVPKMQLIIISCFVSIMLDVSSVKKKKYFVSMCAVLSTRRADVCTSSRRCLGGVSDLNLKLLISHLSPVSSAPFPFDGTFPQLSGHANGYVPKRCIRCRRCILMPVSFCCCFFLG